MSIEQKQFLSRDELTQALSAEIISRLNSEIELKGIAGLAVSGGRTPVDLFNSLSKASIDWSKVVITLIDERWVEPNDEASNEKLVRTHLLINQAASAIFIAHKTSHDTPFLGQPELNKQLQALPEYITVSILGMGEDGHTASFFPGAETLARALQMDSGVDCCATVPKTAPHQRMTLTLPRILKSHWIVLHLTGDSKLPVLDHALQDGAIEELPVRSVLKQTKTPVAVYFAS